jgi:hypothetical protein
MMGRPKAVIEGKAWWWFMWESISIAQTATLDDHGVEGNNLKGRGVAGPLLQVGGWQLHHWSLLRMAPGLNGSEHTTWLMSMSVYWFCWLLSVWRGRQKELFRELSQVCLSNPLTRDCVSGVICKSQTQNMLIDGRKYEFIWPFDSAKMLQISKFSTILTPSSLLDFSVNTRPRPCRPRGQSSSA